MKTLILVLAASMFVAAESLTCHTCRFGYRGKCVFPSTETCSDSEPNCYCGNLIFNNTRLMRLETRGCLASSLCNQTESGALLTVGYTVTKTCCSTDLCNKATSVQLSLVAALSTAMLAFWSS
ncbi:uncharacterized protein V6R79_024368 [Siganus canaliculatus]